MLVTRCFLHVTRTIWAQLAEMSDLLWRRNAKWKTVKTSIFKHHEGHSALTESEFRLPGWARLNKFKQV